MAVSELFAAAVSYSSETTGCLPWHLICRERLRSQVTIFVVPDGRRPRPILPLGGQARFATRHNLGIRTYRGRAGHQGAMLLERAAWFERSLRKAVDLAGTD